MQKIYRGYISPATLQLLAAAFMLCESVCITFMKTNRFLDFAGSLALPILSFIVVEGYFSTKDLKGYIKKLLVLAVLSEIPFNLMYSSTIIYPFQQNVVLALFIGLLLVHFNETALRAQKKWFSVVIWAISIAAAVAAGYYIVCDYWGTAVIMVLVFYLFRGHSWLCFAGQAASLYYISVVLKGGVYCTVSLFGTALNVDTQLFSLLALVPIWLYTGRQNRHSDSVQRFCCAFYPLHMLVLAIMFING